MGFDVVRHESVLHNPLNEVTGGVERVYDATGRTLIRKQLRRPQEPDGAGRGTWSASLDPRHWNYWRREAEVYRSRALRESLRRTGLDLPRGKVSEDATGVTLWLEDVAGRPGPEFALADHAAVAGSVGRWQAQGPLRTRWASRRFLRDYSTSRDVPWHLLDDDAAWRQPLVRDLWPSRLREDWPRLVAAREWLLRLMERLPRTRCHLDLWVANQVRRPDGEIVLLDWAFAGDGAVGEDAGNHVPDAVHDLFWPAERIAELDRACFDSYLAGLREAGWAGDTRQVRLGMVASCVKYAWLVPLMLGQAGADAHRAYHRPVDSEQLYRARGLSFTHLVGWLDEALALAG